MRRWKLDTGSNGNSSCFLPEPMEAVIMRNSICVRLLCLVALSVSAASLTAAKPAKVTCGSSTAPLGQALTWAVQRMTVDGDTDTQHILAFKTISPTSWVTDETTCKKILATVDKRWSAPRGGPVYVMQVGPDYAVIQGDRKSGPNRVVMHVDSAFKFVAGIVWQ
jgi:hypothetical protein